MKKEIEYFKIACYTENLTGLYKQYVKDKVLRHEDFIQTYRIPIVDEMGRMKYKWKDIDEYDNLTAYSWSPSSKCRACNKKVVENDFDSYNSYWIPNIKFNVHKACKEKQAKYETREMQIIDTNCNDCTYFVRSYNKKPFAYGNCSVKNIKLSTLPNICLPYNKNCFKHRKINQ